MTQALDFAHSDKTVTDPASPQYASACDIDALGFGSAGIAGLFKHVSDDVSDATIRTALECGIRAFDTAPWYGCGLAERRLGRMLPAVDRAGLRISSKVGRIIPESGDGGEVEWNFSRDGILRSLTGTLQRLGVDRVDVLYLHDPEFSPQGARAALAEGLAALLELRDQGVVGQVGVGSASIDAHLFTLTEADVDVLMVAGGYTLLGTPAAERLLPECVERGVAVASAGAYNTGVLATKLPGEDAHYGYERVRGDVLSRARAIAAVCEEFGTDLPTAALQFGLRSPAIKTVVVGADSPEQVAENVERLSAAVPDALWDALASLNTQLE